MKLTSVDPSFQSKHCAWASWLDKKPYDSGVIEFPDDGMNISHIRKEAVAIVDSHKPDIIIIESQYRKTGKNRRNIHAESIIKCAKASAVFETLDIPYKLVPPEDWISHFGLWKIIVNKKILIAYAQGRAKELGYELPACEHQCCAFLIGLYFIESGDKDGI